MKIPLTKHFAASVDDLPRIFVEHRFSYTELVVEGLLESITVLPGFGVGIEYSRIQNGGAALQTWRVGDGGRRGFMETSG